MPNLSALSSKVAHDAVAAYRDRLPKMIELAKAIAMAGLETGGEYKESRHDAFFASFGDSGLDARDYDLFPDYLICSHAEDMRPRGYRRDTRGLLSPACAPKSLCRPTTFWSHRRLPAAISYWACAAGSSPTR